MKVLAVVFTRGNINQIRPEAEQFIEMHKRGVDIDIICHPQTEYEEIFKSYGIKIVGQFPHRKNDKQATQNIRELLGHKKYDVLHVLHRAAIACGIKAAKGLPVKVVVYRGASGLYWHDPTAYQNALHPRVDKVICVCDDIKNNLRKQLFFKGEKAITIYKGHRLDWYQNVQPKDLNEFGIPKNAFIITCSAINRKWKGIPTFLEAIQLLPSNINFRVLLIGTGMDSVHYKQQIAQNINGSKIHLLGFRNDVLEIVKSTHVFMQTSYKNEGLSRSTIEAMCLGAVPVVTNAGGNAELVLNENCGFVVPIKDPQGMAQAILKLYQNRDLLQQFSEAAKKRIQTHFSVEQTTSKTIEVYEDLLRK